MVFSSCDGPLAAFSVGTEQEGNSDAAGGDLPEPNDAITARLRWPPAFVDEVGDGVPAARQRTAVVYRPDGYGPSRSTAFRRR